VVKRRGALILSAGKCITGLWSLPALIVFCHDGSRTAYTAIPDCCESGFARLCVLRGNGTNGYHAGQRVNACKFVIGIIQGRKHLDDLGVGCITG